MKPPEKRTPGAGVAGGSKLEWALAAVRGGLPVFPLTWTDDAGVCSCGNPRCDRQGKHPLPKSHGFKDATLDEDQVRRWWADRPDANIGIYPGEEYVVVDLDLKNGLNGLETICEHLDVEPWELLGETRVTRTTTGGYHLFYKADRPYASGVSLLPGVDVRGVGGYVVGPGSSINGKAYVVENDSEPVVVREDLRPLLKPYGKREKVDRTPLFELDSETALNRARDFLRLREPAVAGSGGDDHTLLTAQRVIDFGVSENKCLELMAEHWNSRCDPPWEVFGNENTLERKVRNAWKYRNEPPGIRGGEAEDLFGSVKDLETEMNGVEIADEEKPKNRWYRLLRRGDALQQMKPAETVVPGWLPASGVTAILAKKGEGKTVIAVDLALSLAAESKWCGESVMKGLYVVYLCGEDQENTAGHIKAWYLKRNKGEVPRRFIFVEDVPELNNDKDCGALLEAVREQVPEGARVAWFLDTWQRATAGAKHGQNADQEMQPAFKSLEVLASEFNGPALGCFHPPKSNPNTIHGSGVMENMTVAIWELEEDKGGKKLTVTRIKGRGMGSYKRFRFETVGLGERDAHNCEVTGALPVHTGGTLAHRYMETYDRDAEEREAKEREGVYSAVVGYLRRGRHVINNNNARSSAVQPEHLRTCLKKEYGIELTKKEMKEHLAALEATGRLTYRETDKKKHLRASYTLPDSDADEMRATRDVSDDIS